MRRTVRYAALCLCVSASVPANAQDYAVTGVAADDRLNIRAGIDTVQHFSDAPVVTSIAPDATGIAATGRSVSLHDVRWLELRHGGATGWANARYLRLETLFPAAIGYRCGGTEPFWDITFDETGGRISGLSLSGEVALRLDGVAYAVGRPDVHVYHFTGRSDGQRYTAIQSFEGDCSDGMSDYLYAWELYLLGLDPAGGVFHACCSTR
jgi:uncharacterized membrane protein